MKKTVKYISSLLLAMVSGAFAQSSASMPAPENPATGIWIQQKGDIVPHAATKATLYYTKYENDKNGDRIKSISYQYDGAGYLLMKPSDKKTLCSYNDGVRGADGIVHHPDGDLIIAGQQGGKIYKVSKTAKADGGKCLVKTAGFKFLFKYRITQIKEKFGGLRWYDAACPRELYDVIGKYESISFHTCICCGKPAKYITSGWICPYCEDCISEGGKEGATVIDENGNEHSPYENIEEQCATGTNNK